jgi:hypothetical protein
MSEHKTIEEILDEKISFKDNYNAFYREMKRNLKLETICILSCETGEWLTEIGAFLAGCSFQNEIGILGGVSAGASYALYHVYKHAKKHGKEKASFIDAAWYAGSTESGCVIGATLAEYSAGKFIVSSNNPLTLGNAAIRAATLVPAFGIGLVLMSTFTYWKRRECSRGISEKKVLENLKPSLEYKIDKDKLEILGKGSSLIINEKNLPKTYQNSFDKTKYSLYAVDSDIVRAKPEYCHEVDEYCEELFQQAGHKLELVDNIYSCASHHNH